MNVKMIGYVVLIIYSFVTPLQKRADKFYPNTLLKMGKP